MGVVLGKIIGYLGPMFSGKTSRLLDSYERQIIAKKRALLFKPKMDNRYSESSVTTHTGKDYQHPGGLPV